MSAGTITLTHGSTAVKGVSTAFDTELTAADFIIVTVGGTIYSLAIDTVTNATTAVLSIPFNGPTATGVAWQAVPRKTMLRVTAELNKQVTESLRVSLENSLNWQAVLSANDTVTVILPDGTTLTGYSWKKIVELLKDIDTTTLQGIADQVHADAAQVATDKAAAAGSATTASQKATAAAGSATTAGQKATAAAGSAGTATTKASEAADSAAAAAASAGSIHPENLLQKVNHLSEFAAETDAAAARGNLKVYSKSEVDAKGSGGEYPGKVSWHPSSNKLEGGTIRGDGQKITTAKVLYPDLVQRVIDGFLPSTTETTWQSQPLARAAYVYDAAADTLRVPDYNGVQSGSLPIPMQAGDGGSLASGSMQKGGVPNIKGKIQSATGYGLVNTGAPAEGALGVDESTTLKNLTGGDQNTSRPITIDASKSSDLYVTGLTEIRVNRFIGCYVIRAATNVVNGGTVDMLQLQADLSALKTAAEATNSKIGYAKVDVPGTPALNSRTVVNNPFGNSTPVSCWAEIYHATLKKWVRCDWISSGQSSASIGIFVAYSEGEGLVLKTGASAFIATTPYSPTSQEVTANYVTPSPIRIHVISVGNDISKLKQISQIDPILIQEFKAPAKPTGFRQVWARTTAETGGNGTNLTFSESILGQKVYMVAETANRFSLALDIPAKPLPASTTVAIAGLPTGSFTVAAAVDNASWLIGVSPDGLTGKVVATTIALLNLYVDDYSVQP